MTGALGMRPLDPPMRTTLGNIFKLRYHLCFHYLFLNELIISVLLVKVL